MASTTMAPNLPSTLSSQAASWQLGLGQLRDKLPETAYVSLCSIAIDEDGRFGVWAANIGVLKDTLSPSSLDARLRLADHKRAIMASMLNQISKSVDKGKAQSRIKYIFLL